MSATNEEYGKSENILARAVAEAKAGFEAAKKELVLARARSVDLPKTHPNSELLQTAAAYDSALAKYREALMAYNRFIMDGEAANLKIDG